MLALSDYPMPKILTDIPEINVCFQIAAEMVGFFIEEIEKLEKELDTDFASELGISKKEKMYKIVPAFDDTLEERRFRVKFKERQLNILNYETFEKSVNDIAENVDIQRSLPQGKISVNVGLASLKNFDALKKFIEAYIPVWMNLEIKQMYRTFLSYKDKTYQELSEKTFNEIREETEQ